MALAPADQGCWYEWLVAQELWRRAAIEGQEAPELLRHWSSKRHELDFVVGQHDYIEVEHGHTSPLEFAWFNDSLGQGELLVLGADRFDTARIRGRTLVKWLRDRAHCHDARPAAAPQPTK